MDHGQNFQNLILEYPHEALEFFASTVVRNLSRNGRITPIREEQIKNRLGDRFRELECAGSVLSEMHLPASDASVDEEANRHEILDH